MGNQVPVDQEIQYKKDQTTFKILFSELKGKEKFMPPADELTIKKEYHQWYKSVSIKDPKTKEFLQRLPLKYKYRIVQRHYQKIKESQSTESRLLESQKLEQLKLNLRNDEEMDPHNIVSLLLLLQTEDNDSVIWKEFFNLNGVDIFLRILDREEKKSRKSNTFKQISNILQLFQSMCQKELTQYLEGESTIDIIFRCIHPIQIANTVSVLEIMTGENGILVYNDSNINKLYNTMDHFSCLYQYNNKFESILTILYESDNIVMALNLLLFIQNILICTGDDLLRDFIIDDLKSAIIYQNKNIFDILSSIQKRIQFNKYSIDSTTFEVVSKKLQNYQHPLVYPKATLNQQSILMEILDSSNQFVQTENRQTKAKVLKKQNKIYLDKSDDEIFSSYQDNIMVIIVTIQKLIQNQPSASDAYSYFDSKNYDDSIGGSQFYSTQKLDIAQQMQLGLSKLVESLVKVHFDINTVNLVNNFNQILQGIHENPKSAGQAVHVLQNANNMTDEIVKLKQLLEQKDQEIKSLIEKKNALLSQQKQFQDHSIHNNESDKTKSLDIKPPIQQVQQQNIQYQTKSLVLPPPPSLLGLSSLVPKKARPTPSCKMRNFMWNTVPFLYTKGTIWEEISDENVEINIQKIEQDYQKIEEEQVQNKPGKSRPQLISLISKDRSQNYELILSKLKISTSILVDSLLQCDFTVLNYEVLNSLDQLNPRDEDIKIVSSYQEDIKLLAIPEQYLIQMIKIPLFKERIKALKFVLTYQESISDIYQKACILHQALECIQNDPNIKEIFTNLLAYGNYINSQSDLRGGAFGFKIDTIEKALDFKNNNNDSNLLQDAIRPVFQINEQNIDHFDFQLTKIQILQKIIAKQQMAELNQIKQNYLNFRKVIDTQTENNELDKIKDTLEPHDSKIKLLISQAEAQLIDCEQKCTALIKYYGENNESQENFADKMYKIKKSILKAMRQLFVQQKDDDDTTQASEMSFTLKVKSLNSIKEDREKMQKELLIASVLKDFINN